VWFKHGQVSSTKHQSKRKQTPHEFNYKITMGAPATGGAGGAAEEVFG
jgi:hypothetical protein